MYTISPNKRTDTKGENLLTTMLQDRGLCTANKCVGHERAQIRLNVVMPACFYLVQKCLLHCPTFNFAQHMHKDIYLGRMLPR